MSEQPIRPATPTRGASFKKLIWFAWYQSGDNRPVSEMEEAKFYVCVIINATKAYGYNLEPLDNLTLATFRLLKWDICNILSTESQQKRTMFWLSEFLGILVEEELIEINLKGIQMILLQ